MMDEIDDSTRFSHLVKECVDTSSETIDNVKKMLDRLKNSSKEREGITLLEVKNREMLSYLAETSFLLGRMSCGASIANDPAVLRAAKNRTILEKLRPIESKMRSQIDKLTQNSKSANGKPTLKARPDQMELDDESEEDKDDEDDEEGAKTKKYVPPKIMAMRYDEEDDEEVGKKKSMERAKKRAIQSSLIQELKEQYSEAPQELREGNKKKYDLEKRREQYEEDNYVRIQLTRAQRIREQKMDRENVIDDLLHFGSYMMRGEDGEKLGGAKRKVKVGLKGGPNAKKGRLTQKERKKEKKTKKKIKNRLIMRKS